MVYERSLLFFEYFCRRLECESDSSYEAAAWHRVAADKFVSAVEDVLRGDVDCEVA